MRRRLPLLFAATLAALALAPSSRAQQARVPAALAGTFVYPHPDEHARRVVLAAMEGRIQSLPPMVQGMARDRRRERTHVARRVIVRLEGERVHVEFEGDRDTTVDTPLGGSTTVQNAAGQEARVTQHLRGGWLEQVYTGPSGEMRLLLSTEPDGLTLHVDTTISGARLGEPVRWRHDYTRSAQ